MTCTSIIKKLSVYLDNVTISRLEIVCSRKKDLGICFVVADIFRDNEFSPKDEEIVDELLTKLVPTLFI